MAAIGLYCAMVLRAGGRKSCTALLPDEPVGNCRHSSITVFSFHPKDHHYW